MLPDVKSLAQSQISTRAETTQPGPKTVSTRLFPSRRVPTVLQPRIWMNRARDVFNPKPCNPRIHKARRAHVQEVRSAKRKLKTVRCPDDIPDEERSGHKMSFVVSRCIHCHPRKGQLKG